MKAVVHIEIKNDDVRGLAPEGDTKKGHTVLQLEDGSSVSLPNETVRRIQAVWDAEKELRG